ncbi:helix-turn-helix domain-containing protein [Nocardioides ungokensis]
MARSPDVLEDPTPLDSPRVDVRVRVAWLLRMSRAAGIDGEALSVTEMAHRLKDRGISASAPSVSGWETGRVAPGTAVLEAYEAVLGREPGMLRSAVDVVRRNHGHDRPGAVVPPPRLVDLDRATDRVLGSRRTTGLDWLHFCEAALAVRPGLPRKLLRPAVDQLLSEVSRSVFTAYVTRYEALSLLRCGQYGGLVLQAVRDYVDEPGAQVVAEALGVVAERADRPCLRLLVPHLASEDPVMLRGAVVGFQNLASVGGLTPADWDQVVAPFVAAFNAHADDERQWLLLSNLWHALPPSVRTATRPDLVRPVNPAPPTWDPARLERHTTFCDRVTARVCDEVGIPHQPLLARLLFEAAFDPRGDRSWTATLLMMASPLRGPIAAAMSDAADHHEDPVVRAAARDLLTGLGHEASTKHALAWLDGGEPDLVAAALVELAHNRSRVPDDRLSAFLEEPDPVGRRALYYAGMMGRPALRRIAEDPAHRLHEGARWWRRHGSVITS